MNSTKDELREKIHKLGQRYGYFWVKAFDIDYELNEDRVFREAFIDQLLDMFAERERLASQKAIDYFYWRIDCSTLISELEGWRGCIDMAKHQTEEHLSALQPSNKKGK